MTRDETAPAGIDPTVPSVARMYDYYLGGKDNFASDREAAEQIVQISLATGANVKEMALANRGFLIRAVRHIAESGVRQFLDIGAGLPTQDNVHQVAQRVAPDSRIVYVDNDPIVLVHARALLADNPLTVVAEGNLHDPASILSDPRIQAHLDFGRPVAILLAAVFHFFHDDDEVGRIVDSLRDVLAPGSFLVISHSYIDKAAAIPDKLEEARGVYNRSTSKAVAWRDVKQVEAYFAGLELLEPGVVPVQRWRNDDPYEPEGLSIGGVLGGVARVP